MTGFHLLHKLQPVNYFLPPFIVLKAEKGSSFPGLFRTEPPRIGHYREPPRALNTILYCCTLQVNHHIQEGMYMLSYFNVVIEHIYIS